jgi:hypothetical protein
MIFILIILGNIDIRFDKASKCSFNASSIYKKQIKSLFWKQKCSIVKNY